MRNVTAIILGGGFGSRLRSVVGDLPKVMAQVAGRPFLSYLLDQVVEAHVTEVILSTGFMARNIEEVYGNSYGPLHITYAEEPSPLGTGGAIRFAAESAHHETLLVMNGDSLVDMPLQELLDFHDRKRNDASFVLVKVDNSSRFGNVTLDPDDRIVEFQEKCEARQSSLINGGVYAIQRQLVDAIPDGPCSFERDIAPAWVRTATVRGYQTDGAFIDIGIPESYADSHQFLRGLQRA